MGARSSAYAPKGEFCPKGVVLPLKRQTTSDMTEKSSPELSHQPEYNPKGEREGRKKKSKIRSRPKVQKTQNRWTGSKEVQRKANRGKRKERRTAKRGKRSPERKLCNAVVLRKEKGVGPDATSRSRWWHGTKAKTNSLYSRLYLRISHNLLGESSLILTNLLVFQINLEHPRSPRTSLL